MRSILQLLFITLLLVLIPTSAALATDIFDAEWTGWYAGAFGGYLNGKLTSNDQGHFETTGEFEDNSPILGLHAGVNRRTEGGWIIGGELILPLYMDKGTAVDTLFFPDADPQVIYEADYKWSVMVAGKVGKPKGRLMPYGLLAVGLANVDGKTLNLDENNVYTPGAEQSANATHLVYQLGAGADYALNGEMFIGARLLAFNSNKKQYEMPWNEGEKNSFGLNSLLMQVQINRKF